MKRFLMLLIGFVAISVISFGLLLMVNSKGVWGLDVSILSSTQFSSFLMPGLLLVVIIGGLHLIAFMKVFRDQKNAFLWSLFAGLILCIWVVFQIYFTRSYYFLNWTYLIIAFFIVLISLQLRHKELF